MKPKPRAEERRGVARLPAGGGFALVLGDVDRDGDVDLIVANRGRTRLYFNLLRQLDTPFLVMPGREYRLDVYARYGMARLVDVVFPFVSTATARIPLPPLGILGLDPTRIAALPGFVIPRPAGMGSVSVIVPNVPNAVGVTVYAQALLIQHPVLSRLTNVTADKILR